jgi:hypothetical protein
MTTTVLNFFIQLLKDFYGPIILPIVGYSAIAIFSISLLSGIFLAENWNDIRRGFYIGFGMSITIIFAPISISIAILALSILAIKKVWILYKTRNDNGPVDLEF